MPSRIHESFFDYSYCVFWRVLPVPDYPHHSTEAFPSTGASTVLIWSLFGLFFRSSLNKATQRWVFTGSAKRSITTGPLMLPNWGFPNWFSQNLPIYRDEFSSHLSLQHCFWAVAKKKAILNLNIQKGSFVNPQALQCGGWGGGGGRRGGDMIGRRYWDRKNGVEKCERV